MPVNHIYKANHNSILSHFKSEYIDIALFQAVQNRFSVYIHHSRQVSFNIQDLIWSFLTATDFFFSSARCKQSNSTSSELNPLVGHSLPQHFNSECVFLAQLFPLRSPSAKETQHSTTEVICWHYTTKGLGKTGCLFPYFKAPDLSFTSPQGLWQLDSQWPATTPSNLSFRHNLFHLHHKVWFVQGNSSQNTYINRIFMLFCVLMYLL